MTYEQYLETLINTLTRILDCTVSVKSTTCHDEITIKTRLKTVVYKVSYRENNKGEIYMALNKGEISWTH